MKNKNENEKGLSGLANLGNTCYINSCMQILSHCTQLNNILNKYNKDNIINYDENALLLLEWKDLNDLMWSNNVIIAPKRFIITVKKVSEKKNIELFTNYNQNDLPEFLFFLFDCFHNSLKRNVEININGNIKNDIDNLANECFKMIKDLYTNDYSEIFELFYAINVSTIYSIKNNKLLSFKPEPFSVINLPIPENLNNCSIFDCLNLFTNDEILKDDNAWFNEKTNKKENVKKGIKFWSLPNILILNINRFNNFNKKINTLVSIDINNLNLSEYIIGYNKESFIYDLFGICNHEGNCEGGHYYSYVKNNNKWYKFNDTNVSEINSDKIITNKAYCFFLKKK